MILDVLRLEEKVKKYEGDSKASEKKSEKTADAASVGEIAKLKKELAAKDRDIETLKKQAEGLSREYNDLADKYNATNPDDVSKKDI